MLSNCFLSTRDNIYSPTPLLIIVQFLIIIAMMCCLWCEIICFLEVESFVFSELCYRKGAKEVV